jgi:uncharacterized repeat protein (TIGR01451 family)
MKLKTTILTLLFSAVFLTYTSGVKADTGTYGQYGPGTPSQSIIIDKMVSKPTVTKGGEVSNNYVDNYSPSDPRFKAGDMVFFRIKVKNTSSDRLASVQIKDYVPDHLTPIEGPGNFDAGSRTITYFIGDLNAGEEKTYYFKMQVMDESKLPQDKGVFCELNRAQVTSNNANDEDTSQFCVERQVGPVTNVPHAGPEMGLPLLIGYISTLAGGILLKKKSA